MNETRWKRFLHQWNTEVLANKSYRERYQHLLPEHIQHEPWLGYPPASEKVIHDVEQRLHIVLPPSYRTFLLVSNGWSIVNHSVWRIPPVEEITWYKSHVSGQETIGIIEEIEEDYDH